MRSLMYTKKPIIFVQVLRRGVGRQRLPTGYVIGFAGVLFLFSSAYALCTGIADSKS